MEHRITQIDFSIFTKKNKNAKPSSLTHSIQYSLGKN